MNFLRRISRLFSSIALGLAIQTQTVLLQAEANVKPALAQASAIGINPSGIAPSGSADNFLFTGSFLYNLPISVPPGIAGMQPEVSLQYNSSSGNGWVGNGWDLSFGNIQRATKNRVPTYDANDSYVVTLKGQTQELVRIPDGSYRAKIEGAFQKFVFDQNKWIVTDKTGTKYFFGQTPFSRLDKIAGVNATFSWFLDRIEDRNGNYLTISYTNQTQTSSLYPKEILYTGNTTTARAMDRKITFAIESRPDRLSNYRAGFELVTLQRLSQIETFVLVSGSWKKVASFSFQYINREHTGRSLLSNVQMTGYLNGQSQLVTLAKFNYPPENAGWIETQSRALPEDFTSGPNNWTPTNAQLIDLDADGLSDFVFAAGGIRKTWLNKNGAWKEDPAFALPDNFYHGMEFTELNGDGRLDLVSAQSAYANRAWINTSTGWQETPQHALPMFLTHSDGRPTGARLVDVNGDNRSDLLFSYTTVEASATIRGSAWIKTDSGWESKSSWVPPVPFLAANGSSDNNLNVQMVDLNGDNRIDLVYAPSHAPHQTWINNGNGWTEQPNWAIPENLVTVDELRRPFYPNLGIRFVDVNGDGLADLVASWALATNYRRTYINTGTGWLEKPEWRLLDNLAFQVPDSPSNLQFQDVNGDGMTDYVISMNCNGWTSRRTFLNTGNGWREQADWQVPEYNMICERKNPGVHMADINGDQQSDFLVAYRIPTGRYSRTWLSKGSPHGDLIESVQTMLGGKTVIDYESSAFGTHTFLPFSLWLVSSIRQEDGFPAPATVPITTSFRYKDGFFDIKDREFLGFGVVETIDAENNVTRATYHQKKDRLGNDVPINAFKGRQWKSEFFNSAGQLLTSQESIWTYINPFPNIYFVRPVSAIQQISDGSPTLTTKIETTYDDAPVGPGYGNVTQIYYHGDTAISGDEKIETIEYAENKPLYLLGFPKRTTAKTISGSILGDSQFYYDGSSVFGQILKGNRTDTLIKPELTSTKWLSTKASYNSLGIVTSVTDAMGNRTESTYDAFGFPASVRNALNQSAQTEHDPLTGNVLSQTDVNNQTTRFKYDPMGRLLKVIGPIDSETYPTLSHTYYLATIGNPLMQRVETHQRERHNENSTLWKTSWIDGLGREHRTEQKRDATSSILTNTRYNARGLVDRQHLPISTTDPQDFKWITTRYDSLGRTIEVTRPDNTSTRTSYSGRSTTVMDAKGNIQTSVVDAYGRVISRVEPSVSNPTTYNYDMAGNLISLRDSQGRETTFEYDLLGRKLKMSDPNAGVWFYAYDDNSNLVEQTDARNVKLGFRYDKLNRLVEKKLLQDPNGLTGEAVGSILATYTYDESDPTFRPYSKGKLTSVQDSSGVTKFIHDLLGRIHKEQKVINSVVYEVKTTFDAMGRVTQLTYPGDEKINYSYNSAGQLLEVKNNDGTVLAYYPIYDSQSRLLQLNQANGLIRTNFNFNPLTQFISSIKTDSYKTATPQTIQHYSLDFDSAGNIKSILDNINNARTQTFEYDQLNRLTRAQGEYGDQRFVYDSLGNFISKNNALYEYTDPAHPHAATRVWAGGDYASDSSTVLNWNLNSSDPIYSIRGQVKDGAGNPLPNVPLILHGIFDQGLSSDLVGSTNGAGVFEFRGLPGGIGNTYSLSVSSPGIKSVPSGIAFNPLSSSNNNVNFIVSADTVTLNLQSIRVPRSDISHGSFAAESGNVYSGRIIGGAGYGGSASTESTWKSVSGYSPLPNASDSQAQPVVHLIPAPSTLTKGSSGPRFTTGVYQQSLSFNGTTDLFAFPNSQTISPTSFTLMLWAKPTAAPANYATLITKSTGSPVGQLRNGYRLVMDSTRKIVFEIGTTAGSRRVTSSAAIPLNKWSSVSATYNGTRITLYINGLEAGTLVVTGSLVSNTLPVTIGGSLSSYRHSLPGTFFAGDLDEPRIQGRVWSVNELLTANEIIKNSALYTYDASGNRLTKSASDSLWSYSYDSGGRLKKIMQNGVAHSSFIYDGNGGRVKKITPEGETLYIGKLFEIRPDGSAVNHIFGGGQLICDIVKPISGAKQTYHYQQNHLGSTSLVFDATGQKIQEITYHPFGETATETGISPLRHKYTGQESDKETGLYYYNARYYDPILGRFISADSIVQNLFDPQSLNRFVYCRNNPIILVDPSGHSWLSKNIKKATNWTKKHYTEIGIALQFAVGQWAGVPFLAQTENGRNILAGQLLIGTGAGALAFGGPIAIGAFSGELIGGYSAYRSKGDILSGAIVGGIVGAITGHYGHQFNSGILNGLGDGILSRVAGGAARGAIIGLGSGGTAGYGGGSGTSESILGGMINGAAIGAVLGAGMGYIEYAAQGYPTLKDVNTRGLINAVKNGLNDLAKSQGPVSATDVIKSVAGGLKDYLLTPTLNSLSNAPNVGYGIISIGVGAEETDHFLREALSTDINISKKIKWRF